MDRLVLAEKITWTEAETIMSMEDVVSFGETHDAWQEANAQNEVTE